MKLIDFLEFIDERNTDSVLGQDTVVGISTSKCLIETKANLIDVKLNSYKIVHPNYFVFVSDTSRRGDRIAIACNNTKKDYLVSSIYNVIKSKDPSIIDERFFEIFFTRGEFDRLARFNSWGSARETISNDDFLNLKISLPSNIDVQRQYANAYNTLRKLAEQNEAIVKPLMDFCTGFMAKLLTKYKRVEIGDILEECVELNGSKYNVDRVIGLSTSKSLIPTMAKMEGVALKGYKVFKNNTIAYVSDTSRRGEKVSMGYNNSEEDYLVSSITTIFKSKDESILNTNFLFLYLCRESFDRYARYNSWGSARETFDWSEMCRVKIPLPPIEVQESIAAIYKCAEKARSIAERAREEMKRICPAMIQRAAHQ